MSYVYPDHDAVAFSWEGEPSYIYPDHDAVSFSWEEIGAPTSWRFYGTTRDKTGALAQRRVIATLDSTGECIGNVLSDPVTGEYEIQPVGNDPHTLIFTGEADRNALVFTGIMPEEIP